MTRAEEFAEKRSRVLALLAERGLAGALLYRRPNFSWLGCGARNRVFSGADVASGALLVTPERTLLVCNNIERPRLLMDELDGLPLDGYREYAWFEEDPAGAVREELGDAAWACDVPLPGAAHLEREIGQLRYQLTAGDVERYADLCMDAEEIVNRACRDVNPGEPESHVAARMIAAAAARRIDMPVCLVASDERIRLHRHALPTEKKIERHAMLVMGGERAGLYVSLTRFIHFGQLPAELREKHDAVCRIDATLAHHTRPGAVWGEVLQKGIDVYAETGFANEWKLHHQGGPAGYQPRDFKVGPGEARKVVLHQGVAWNPSITGAKSEDTQLVLEDRNVYLSAARDWPMVEVQLDGKTYARPDVLIR